MTAPEHLQSIPSPSKLPTINLFQPTEAQEIPDNFSITCTICEHYVCVTAETKCSHIFCSRCINQYALFCKNCPVCHSKIRHQIFYSNIILDNMIFQYIKKYDGKSLAAFQKKLQNFRQFKKKSRVPQYGKGIYVDVRDKNYIWRCGKILETSVNKHGNISKVLLRYDKAEKELINIHEQRIVVKGTFTSRKEIPHFYRRKLAIKIKEKFYYIESQEEEEEQQKKQEVEDSMENDADESNS